ncbi:glycosyl hydrolase [Paenibacillus sp. GCM10023250]|uniref:glycosyl hydrolase n=1 Tax=Paenibacillus sp. GCM10023250 TaxID=3252648 RepID=UPI00361CBF06
MSLTTDWIEEAWARTVDKVKRTSGRIGSGYPHASVNGRYTLEAPDWWTAGFWPGLLWLLHDGSGEASFRQLAEACEGGLDAVLDRYDELDHDMGFIWALTSVARYKRYGAEDSRNRALLAAGQLAGRFNLKGNYIRAWNPWRANDDNAGLAIIDCAMNMPLLFWASAETGDPRFRHVAEAHLDTVLREFVRPDGSVYHIVRFDPETGERLERIGGQGFAPESAWSRGTAWALYGLALAYRHTGRTAYLDGAKRVAHFFVAHLPADHVPHWDFRLPDGVERFRDTSAGACAACGLLLLADCEPAHGAPYRAAGVRILESLYRSYGAWDDDGEEGLIRGGTSHYPERKHVDVPLVYGDYFFIEGLARLRGAAVIAWE